jgi:hypothetical protein
MQKRKRRKRMGMTSEGTISIPLTEFWKFVAKFHDNTSAEVAYGVPRVSVNDDLEIDFAASTEGPPKDWMHKPKAVLQWEELRKGDPRVMDRATVFYIAAILGKTEDRRYNLKDSDKVILDDLLQELRSLM